MTQKHIGFILLLSIAYNGYSFWMLCFGTAHPTEKPLSGWIAKSGQQSGQQSSPDLDGDSIREHFRQKTDRLKMLGLPAKVIRDAIIPLINKEYSTIIWGFKDEQSFLENLDHFKHERRKLVKDLFDNDPTRADWDESLDAYLDTSLEFRFSNKNEEARHLFFRNMCGVDLDINKKELLFKIHETTSDDPVAFQEAVSRQFDPETARLISASQNANFSKYYRYTFDPKLDSIDKSSFAGTLVEISALRKEAIAEWESPRMSTSTKEYQAAGKRSVELQIRSHIESELGKNAVKMVDLNGW